MMKIELKLSLDQSLYGTDPESELLWELYVNGEPFPDPTANALSTSKIDKIVKFLVDLEEMMS